MEAKLGARAWLGALAVAVVVVAGGTGCTTGADGDGGPEADGVSEAKCAYLVKYEERSYLDVRGRAADEREFTVGKSLGTGLLPGCHESGEVDGTEEPERVTVYEVEGVDPAVAVAAGESPGKAVLVAVEGADLESLDVTS
ncbi:DUF6281 family protein [Streptomyces sp. SHP 1-2]|uniref:DUF6281 family protein n=1 Tax=Streptomyces sp. SHP 1-2 TaxID=2769489 RepID=UPI002238CE42|nr:DUF6281 family protein [Streptomyces sp. SHP 1-2]MCW5254692.1 hypothetical protein [Streptomyces sp. SHP 1-2]